MEMLKREQRLGTGEKQSDVITVQPYNENRVVLHDLELELEEDPTFINASFVDNSNYIAAAMPHNLASERDFWRMTYETGAHSVVMLNKPTERKKIPYWPSPKEKIRSYSDVIKVVLLEERYDDQIYCWVRKLRVVVNRNHYDADAPVWDFTDDFLAQHSYEFQGELSAQDEALRDCSKAVSHIQYDDWDDMRVPDDKTVFYQFISLTSRQHEENKHRGPMVVHCFGGVGRTGTFLVIHSAIQKMTRLGGKTVNVVDMLGMLRTERSSLVQTPEQYKFCYRMIWQYSEDRKNFRAALSGLEQIRQQVRGNTGKETVVQNE